jgi:uncharacterized lipoprotein YmbA
MTATAISRRRALLCAAITIALAGCASTPQTEFYTLADFPLPAAAAPLGEPPLTVGVGPVKLPAYIDRPEIVLRVSDYKVDLLTFDNWAAPLDQRFPEALISDMQLQMPFARVIAYPPRLPTPADVQIEISVERFDVDASGTAVLIANWWLRGPQARPLPYAGKAEVSANAAENTMAGRVAALSEAVAKLGRKLVGAVLDVPAGALHAAASQSPGAAT